MPLNPTVVPEDQQGTAPQGHNLARLAQGFPDEVAGFLAWNRGDLADRLQKAGLEL